MSYGSATTVQELVWGSAKATVPGSVSAALSAATIIINSKFNIKTELTGDDKPSDFDSMANLLAAGIIQEQKEPGTKSVNTIRGEQLIQDFKDDTYQKTRGEPYHIRFVEP